MKNFESLLKSEIRKAEKLANKVTGFNDCKVTAYCSRITHPIEFDPTLVYVEVECEICRNYEEPVDCNVNLTIPMYDRRTTWAWAIVDGKYTLK